MSMVGDDEVEGAELEVVDALQQLEVVPAVDDVPTATDVDIDPVIVAPSLGETEAPPHVQAPVDGEIDTPASRVGETEAAIKFRQDKNWRKFCLGKGNTCTKFGRQNGLCKACTRLEMAMETA